MFARVCRLGLIVFMISACAAPTYADPIVVSGGGTFLYWDGSGTNVTLQGDGLQVVTDAYGGGLFILPSGVTNLDGTMSFGSIGIAPIRWTVTVNGTQYAAYLSGSLAFDADPLLVPPVPGRDEATVTFSTPFTMNGRMVGTTGMLGAGSVVFDVLLTGTGTASANAFAVDTNLYRIGGVRYDFAPAAATPEPATLVLMGTGLAGVLLRRRRRSRLPTA